jgi:hypothetical protein
MVTRAVSAAGSDHGRPGRTGPPGGASDHWHSRVGLRSVRVSLATEHLHEGGEVAERDTDPGGGTGVGVRGSGAKVALKRRSAAVAAHPKARSGSQPWTGTPW